MSYHILHQFDEQWFADSAKEAASSRPDDFLRTHNERGHERQNSLTKLLQHPWLIVGASLVIAALALYFAMDARRQTIELKQRLNDVESKLKK